MTSEHQKAALLIRLGDQRYGVPLSAVERVLPMAAVLVLPESDDGLLGMLNLHGSVLPVVDPRARLGLVTPGVAAGQRLILLRGATQFLMWVDEVDDVIALSPESVSEVPTSRTSPVVTSVVRLNETIVPLLAPGALEPRVIAT
jgi:purine-binding chemotaxis protein CheW